MSLARDEPSISIGGFKGLPSKVVTKDRTKPQSRQLEHQRGGAERHPQYSRKVEEAVVKLASVPFEGWDKEKEGRVKVAFDRILEHEWYDKYEGNLRA